MFKQFKYKLKPTKEQKQQLQQIGGSTRWLWNYMLNLNTTEYNTNKKFIFEKPMNYLLPQLKKINPWLSDVPSQALQQKCKDLSLALEALKTGSKYPKFKCKKWNNDSFRIPQQIANGKDKHILPTKKQIKIPKIGWIKWNRHRPLEGKLKLITIKQEGIHWYCSCLCELPDITSIKEYNIEQLVGIDMGLLDLAITSDNKIYDTPKYYRNKQNKLAKAQIHLSKKAKRSNNRNKARLKVCKIHTKIKNQRVDYLHKISKEITNQYLFIGVEDLNIKGMSKNKHLSKSILDQGWGIFINQLEYKSLWNGGCTIKINRYAPSTKTCSNCGHKMNIPLNQRIYTCPICGMIRDRDHNAAINIKKWTVIELSRCGTHRINACGDTTNGDTSLDVSSYVSLNQEKISSNLAGETSSFRAR